ncbi:uncharacterized protein LOC118504694 isoform X2 [Anopheles stephensi]|uniref:uncharacterized protein LOC118504694 isoform X2 n=1 Tax=Anopheles stephensi TaxID=30069 RepID=UPI00165889F9|nr:uncharacterized protein LOC118504694 isoform X2 [Anopheles stephensi]
MSADSQRSRSMASSGDGGTNVVRCMPTIVPPQAVSDRSIIDSVAGFINDVTLQAQAPLGDSKDHILWVRFENAADISDPCLGDDWELEGGIAPPLLLILGYVSGVQVWIVPANGEAIEVLSWRHGSVKCLRVLPTPTSGDRESATEPADQYTHKRPLIALCDSGLGGASAASAAATNGSYQYCAVNFVSLKDGETVKSIKFKSIIVDILANRSSIVVTFPERIAVFDARTLEDRLTVTTCHPSPGLNPNPVALGSRWIAYAERRLIPSKRSSGGCEGDGVTSYTATVLNAAKSFGKGLRELGEQVAAGLTGSHLGSSLGSSLVGGGGGGGGGGGSGSMSGGVGGIGGLHTGSGTGSANDVSGILGGSGGGVSEQGNQPGIVTVLDIKHPVKDVSPTTGTPITAHGSDPIVAHFLAHSEAIVALAFDAPGMLLLTADKRGHDFHVFRLHPHPSGASLAAVHHLYVLHRGDTTAKVQDVAFSLDSRWVAVSTLRGTTHVFPVTPYGGPAGVRTHGSPHVVNRLSRFHRSAGLSIDGRSSSPVSHSSEGGTGGNHVPTAMAYANPRTPPFPHPTVVQPLAQLRQPSHLLGGGGGGSNMGVGGGGGSAAGKSMGGGGAHHHTRQRNSSSSSSDDLMKPLRVCASFAKARSWLLDPPGCVVRDTPAHRIQRKPIDSLFIMAAHGALIQYDLEPKHASGTPKEKICDDTPIELEVEAKAQWCLQRQENSSTGDIQPPLSLDNWLIKDRFIEDSVVGGRTDGTGSLQDYDRSQQHPHHRGSAGNVSLDHDDRWLSQVEIITHAGPHRRLWMGPQFMFKTYNTPSGSPLSSIDTEAVDICTGSGGGSTRSLQRSNPMNMPLVGGSYEQSPRMMNMNEFRHHENLDTEFSSLGPVESQLREDLADAMRESPLITTGKDTTGNHSGTGSTCGVVGGAGHPPTQHSTTPAAAAQHALSAITTASTTTTGLSSVSSCSSTSIYSSTHSLSSICDQQHQQLLQQSQQHQQCGGGGCKVSGGGGGSNDGGDPAGCYFECKQPPLFASSGDSSSNKASGLVKKNVGIVQTCAQHPHQLHQHNYYPDPSRPDSGASGRNVYHHGGGGGITIAKVVNPLGTVTTISTVGGGSAGPDSIESDDFMQECVESYLHENCDEALFRPVVTVHHESVCAPKLPTAQELDMVELMRAGRYRGSSLDRTGSGVEAPGKARLVAGGGCEERPLSQPASLIGRDLIVPVIEEKNLPYFTGSAKRQRSKQQQSGVSKRAEVVEPAVVQQREYKNEQSRTRKLLAGKDRQERNDPAADTKASECESEFTTKLNTVDVSLGKTCEDFETIELPVVESDPLEGEPKRDATNSPKGRKDDDGGGGSRADAHGKSYPLTSSATFGCKKSKDRKSIPPPDVASGAASSSDRNEKKDFSSMRSNTPAQEKKGTGSAGNEKRTSKRTGNTPKGKDSRREKESSSESKRSASPVVVMLDSDPLLLPPLEALKIDDLELFGDDTTVPVPPVDVRAKASEPTVGKGGDDSEMMSHETGRSSALDTYYDPLASDEKYEVMEFGEQPHGCPDLAVLQTTGAQCPASDSVEKTLISFESPLAEKASDGGPAGSVTTQQEQLVADMQSVFTGGNIMVAMCSSLREASPSVEPDAREEEEPPLTRSSSQCVVKQVSLEGQDSDYKSLELDLDLQSAGGVNTGSSYNPATTDGTATIVSLLSSGSDDEEDVTTNSTTNDQEEDAGGEDTLLDRKPETEPGNKLPEASGKRRRRKRTNTCQTNTTASLITTTTGDAKDADEGEEEEEHGDEDDEELQPLISSNKTSSSSLSAAPTTTKKDSLTYGEGPLLTGTDITVSLTALPSECERYAKGDDPSKQSVTLDGSQIGDATTVKCLTAGGGSSSSSSSIGLSTSLIVSSSTGKMAATVSATTAAGGGGNGGNGKKKSKKKRK